jgi:hypothetical protein
VSKTRDTVRQNGPRQSVLGLVNATRLDKIALRCPAKAIDVAKIYCAREQVMTGAKAE